MRRECGSQPARPERRWLAQAGEEGIRQGEGEEAKKEPGAGREDGASWLLWLRIGVPPARATPGHGGGELGALSFLVPALRKKLVIGNCADTNLRGVLEGKGSISKDPVSRQECLPTAALTHTPSLLWVMEQGHRAAGGLVQTLALYIPCTACIPRLELTGVAPEKEGQPRGSRLEKPLPASPLSGTLPSPSLSLPRERVWSQSLPPTVPCVKWPGCPHPAEEEIKAGAAQGPTDAEQC